MKKILLGMGAMTVVVAPIATVVACADDAEGITNVTAKLTTGHLEFSMPAYNSGSYIGGDVKNPSMDAVRNINAFDNKGKNDDTGLNITFEHMKYEVDSAILSADMKGLSITWKQTTNNAAVVSPKDKSVTVIFVLDEDMKVTNATISTLALGKQLLQALVGKSGASVGTTTGPFQTAFKSVSTNVDNLSAFFKAALK